MVKIAVDAGHGLNTPGKRSPNGEREWTFNDAVVRHAMNRLYEFQNVTILRTDDVSGKTDIPLSARAKRANDFKADVFISVHHNALGSVWGGHEGAETFIMQPKDSNPKSKKLAGCVHPHIVRAMQTKDRGVKDANFAVLRKTNMPAILTEGGFMDSSTDIKKMRNDRFLKAQGEAIANGVAEYLGLVIKPSPKPIVTTTSDKKESVRMFKPSTKTLENEMVKFLETAHKDGILTSDEWEKKAKDGTLTLDDAVALQATVFRRSLEDKK